jgi:hypothetical protein
MSWRAEQHEYRAFRNEQIWGVTRSDIPRKLIGAVSAAQIHMAVVFVDRLMNLSAN